MKTVTLDVVCGAVAGDLTTGRADALPLLLKVADHAYKGNFITERLADWVTGRAGARGYRDFVAMVHAALDARTIEMMPGVNLSLDVAVKVIVDDIRLGQARAVPMLVAIADEHVRGGRATEAASDWISRNTAAPAYRDFVLWLHRLLKGRELVLED